MKQIWWATVEYNIPFECLLGNSRTIPSILAISNREVKKLKAWNMMYSMSRKRACFKFAANAADVPSKSSQNVGETNECPAFRLKSWAMMRFLVELSSFGFSLSARKL